MREYILFTILSPNLDTISQGFKTANEKHTRDGKHKITLKHKQLENARLKEQWWF
jgi:hypothetical protein